MRDQISKKIKVGSLKKKFNYKALARLKTKKKIFKLLKSKVKDGTYLLILKKIF